MVCGLLKSLVACDDRSYAEESHPRSAFPLYWRILILNLGDFCKRALHFKVELVHFISYFQTALNKTSRFVFTQSLQPKESMA